jgi:membrane-anchored protein YejM (alkaline phosphatase superfamily)
MSTDLNRAARRRSAWWRIHFWAAVLASPLALAAALTAAAPAAAEEDAGAADEGPAPVDDMIGVLLQGIADLHAENNTYVIFTSDNGFHLGEHMMLFGLSRNPFAFRPWNISSKLTSPAPMRRCW